MCILLHPASPSTIFISIRLPWQNQNFAQTARQLLYTKTESTGHFCCCSCLMTPSILMVLRDASIHVAFALSVMGWNTYWRPVLSVTSFRYSDPPCPINSVKMGKHKTWHTPIWLGSAAPVTKPKFSTTDTEVSVNLVKTTNKDKRNSMLLSRQMYHKVKICLWSPQFINKPIMRDHPPKEKGV